MSTIMMLCESMDSLSNIAGSFIMLYIYVAFAAFRQQLLARRLESGATMSPADSLVQPFEMLPCDKSVGHPCKICFLGCTAVGACGQSKCQSFKQLVPLGKIPALLVRRCADPCAKSGSTPSASQASSVVAPPPMTPSAAADVEPTQQEVGCTLLKW